MATDEENQGENEGPSPPECKDYLLRGTSSLAGLAIAISGTVSFARRRASSEEEEKSCEYGSFGTALSGCAAWAMLLNLWTHVIFGRKTDKGCFYWLRWVTKAVSYLALISGLALSLESNEVCAEELFPLLGPMMSVFLQDAFSAWSGTFKQKPKTTLHQWYWTEDNYGRYQEWSQVSIYGSVATPVGIYFAGVDSNVQGVAMIIAFCGAFVTAISAVGWWQSSLCFPNFASFAEAVSLFGTTIPGVMFELGNSTSSLLGGVALALVGADELLELILALETFD